MIEKHSVETRLAFAQVTLLIYEARLQAGTGSTGILEKSLEHAQVIFAKAGIELESFVKKEPEKEIKGRPPRGNWVVLRETWKVDPHGRRGSWQVSSTWEGAIMRRARVVSRKALRGRKGEDGNPLEAFNVRATEGPGGGLAYSPMRLYVADEGVTWKWA